MALQGYWLDESQLPPFISPQLAQKVLRAGKSINFLQVSQSQGGRVTDLRL
jgi:hypothetical protein